MVDSTNLPDVDINQIATDLNGKMDRDGVNATASVCVESWHDENGNWYRVYSDGWCEQGGSASVPSSAGYYNYDLHKPFIDTNYNIIGSFGSPYGADFTSNRAIYPYTTTQFRIETRSTTGTKEQWRACGYIR